MGPNNLFATHRAIRRHRYRPIGAKQLDLTYSGNLF